MYSLNRQEIDMRDKKKIDIDVNFNSISNPHRYRFDINLMNHFSLEYDHEFGYFLLLTLENYFQKTFEEQIILV